MLANVFMLSAKQNSRAGLQCLRIAQTGCSDLLRSLRTLAQTAGGEFNCRLASGKNGKGAEGEGQ